MFKVRRRGEGLCSARWFPWRPRGVPHERCGLGGQPACGTSPFSPRDPSTPRFSPAVHWRSHRAAGALATCLAWTRQAKLSVCSRQGGWALRALHVLQQSAVSSPVPARGHLICPYPSETALPEEGRLLPGAGRNTQSLTKCLLSTHLLVWFPHWGCPSTQQIQPPKSA